MGFPGCTTTASSKPDLVLPGEPGIHYQQKTSIIQHSMLPKEQVPHFNLCQTGAFPVRENNCPNNKPQRVEVTDI